LDEWSFTISGAVDEPVSWPWVEFIELSADIPTVDIHCVTKWSKLGTAWKGVSLDTLLDGVHTEGTYVSRGAMGDIRPICHSRM
jgi:DMSO/TMAO reductase YedYZ molybdopterin-dependent catalytic subunit